MKTRENSLLLYASDVETFRVDAPYCRILFTTRDGGIALFLGAQAVKLGMLEPEQANVLLREWAQRDDPRLAQIETDLQVILRIGGRPAEF